MKAMGELIRSTGTLCRGPPRSCEGVHEFANAYASRVRLCRVMCKDKVAGVIKLRVASTGIDQLAMPHTLLANKKLGNFKRSVEAFGEETGVRLDR